MKDTVTATEAKFRFGELLSEVSFGKNHVHIKKQNKPVAVVIPVEDYQEYRRLKDDKHHMTRQELLAKTDRLRSKQKPLPPGAPDAVQIIRELRKE